MIRRRGRHLVPSVRRLSRGWSLPLSLAILMVVSAVAWADQAEGEFDFAGGGKVANVTAGAAFSLDADLYIVRSGTAAATVSWSGPTKTGTCGGIGGTSNPTGFTMPDPDWKNQTSNGTVKSNVYDSSKESSVTISGTAGSAGSSCTLRYTATATKAASDNGNPMPSGQSNVDFVINFVAPSNTAPQVALTGGPTSVDESSTAEHTYSFSITDPDVGDSWDFVSGYPDCGTAGVLVAGSASITTGTFKCIFDDGPAASTVTVKIEDSVGAESGEASRAVNVSNVAPTASLARFGPANVFTGTTVTYQASATDPSGADTTAGFSWSFDSGASWSMASNQLMRTYDTCGVKTESVLAMDKDGGISDPGDASVAVYDGGWHGAIKPAMRNQVQKGRVIAVQIRVSCDGADISGLSPAIQLVKGEVDPATEPDADSILTPTTVSSADTSGYMRPVDGGYIYNLQIPGTASAGQLYTIRVRPWGSDGAVLQAVVEIRK